MTTEEKWRPRRNKIAQAMLPLYQLYSNACRGSKAMKRPPAGTLDPSEDGSVELPNGTYLWPFPNEEKGAFQARVRRASYENFMAEIIEVYLATLFSEGEAIDRQTVSGALGDDVFENVDLRGNDAATYLRGALKEALLFGASGTFVDHTLNAASLSRRAEQDAGGRPFLKLYTPPDIWDWARDAVSGEFGYLLLSEGWHDEFNCEVWSEWTSTTWRFVDADGAVVVGADGAPAEGAHSFGTVPFELLICDAPSQDVDGEPFGYSALRDVAFLQVEHFNLSSELTDLLRKVNFPLQHHKVDPQDVKATTPTLPIGPDYALMTEAEVTWISPDAVAAETSMKRLDSLEAKIRRLAGVSSRSEESVEARAAAALVWEFSTKFDRVKLRAEQLRAFEVRLWRRVCEVGGEGYDAESISVQYPSEYATAPVPSDLGTLERLAQLGAPIEVLRAQLRTVVLKNFHHRSDLKFLLAAVEAWTPGKAVAP